MHTLLAVDGSDNSYEALRALAHLAHADEVILLHALDVPRPAYPMIVPNVANELYTTMEHSLRDEGERLLDRVVSLPPMDIGPVTKRIDIGSPAEVIANVAQERKIDLIVMGARGLGPVQARLFGSVSHRIVTLGPCATLIVTGPMRSLRQILMPLQGPYDAEAAVRFLSRTPFREPADITLLTVLPQARPAWPSGEAAARRLEEQALLSAQDFVEGVATKLQAAGYRAKAVAVLGSPVEQILREAGKVKPDLILMGTSGRKGNHALRARQCLPRRSAPSALSHVGVSIGRNRIMNEKPKLSLDLAKAETRLQQWRSKHNTPAKVAAAHRKVLLLRVSQSMAFEDQPVSTERLKTLTETRKAS